jgi:Zn-dependent M16 (insulinase) family peptidase
MHAQRLSIAILLPLFALSALAATPAAKPAALDFAQLTEGQAVHGFKVTTLYLNDADRPMGARFVHRKSGFTLDLLRMESVPQGHTWVNSFPVSDQGEPHTQEHLLVGKGKKGRAFAGLDTMWLSTSNAYTEQWRTSYTFYTSAGAEVFFKLLDAELDALLNPDYTDEEIRREVRNFGVTENPDKTLRLEEKGSVYNEMTSSSGNSYDRLFRLGGQLVYGEKHPFSYNSGGEPSGIRTMRPLDIRSFHDNNYYLGNMGSIIAVPPSMPLGSTLARIDTILSKLQGSSPTRPPMRVEDQPKPASAAPGMIAFAEYPNKNAQQPSPVMVVWPALGDLDANESLLADLFFSNVAGDATTNLYKKFIDSKTRTLDVGAKSIGSGVAIEPGRSSYILLNDVDASNLTKEKLEEIRKAVTAELARIAAFEDGSPELAEFNNRIAGRVVETRRALSKFVNSPPRFGFRNTFSEWMNQLLALEKTPGFKKSLTMKPELAAVNALLASKKNFWRDSLKKWGLAGGAEPYVLAAKANSEIVTREETERLARSNAEAARLAAQYNVTDAQEAIKRYGAESEAGSAKIDADAKSVVAPRFVDNPPMTIDDQLQYKASKLAHDVPIVASTFENMSSATTGMALRLDGLPPDDWRYVSLLPLLLTRVGVIDNGQPVSFDLMTERLRKEILSLNATFSTSYRTGRVELMVRGAGNDVAEAQRAIAWMRLVLEHPDWRVENLPRIRDAVDQSLSSLRNTMQGSEESWVNNPPDAYRRQDKPLLLAATSFLTRTHNALRLRWMLKETAPADREAISAYLKALGRAAKSASRADLKALIAGKDVPASLQPLADSLAQLPAGAKMIAADALRDLDLTLVEIPDASLAADWAQLCDDMRDDLLTPPAQVLARLDSIRQRLLHAANARLFVVGSSATQKALETPIAAMVGALDPAPVERPMVKLQPLVEARLRQRGAITGTPVFVGLLAPNMNGGVVHTSVPGVTYADFADREKQLDYLTTRLYAGYGSHGVFLKTIGAGLAYSNGIRGGISSGRLGYYAERTPELPQTIRFVAGVVKDSTRDTSLADYTVAQAFAELRAAQPYESRAEEMANDLADGQTPENVRKFRQSILELRKDPNLGNLLFDRKDAVYARIFPGYTPDWKPVADSVYFVIGPDKQLDAYEKYLQSTSGPEAKLVRLYPRDYWM